MADAPALRCSYCGGLVHVGDRRCAYCHADVATVRCGRCFAVSHVPAQSCSQCGTALGLEATLGPTTDCCPRCPVTMLVGLELSGHPVEECESCAGLFVDHGTLARVTTRADTERGARLLDTRSASIPPTHGPVRYLPCPRCRTIMTPRSFAPGSGVVVDFCRADGIWFDREELTRALAFVASGGLERARARAKEAARAEMAAARAEVLATRSSLHGADPAGAWEAGEPSMSLIELVLGEIFG